MNNSNLSKSGNISVTKVNKLGNPYKLTGDNLNPSIIKTDDRNARGLFHSINLKEWIEVPAHKIKNNRIVIGRPYKNKDAMLFLHIITEENEGENEDPITCENFLMLPCKFWVDYRSPRGEERYQAAKIQENGTIYVSGYSYKEFKVFVPKE